MNMSHKRKVIAPHDRLCFTLYSASKAIISNYRPYLEKIDMTYPQYLVFIALFPDTSLSVKELGNELGLDSGTLTPLLKRMESKGQITRLRDPSDERVVKVTLTEDAKKLEGEIAEMQFEVSCTTGLELDDFVNLRDKIISLTSSLRANAPD